MITDMIVVVTSLRNHDVNRDYKQRGRKALDAAWQLLNSEGWTLEKEVEGTGDLVHSKVIPPKSHKIFRLTASIDVNPKILHEDLFYNMENAPLWNPTVVDCKILEKIDRQTDVSYHISADAGGGVVSSRDFVVVRYWNTRGTTYISAGTSVVHPSMPPVKHIVRGENGPTAFAFRPAAHNSCDFQWLLNINLKGWLPQKVIDHALGTGMLDYVKHLRLHASTLKS